MESWGHFFPCKSMFHTLQQVELPWTLLQSMVAALLVVETVKYAHIFITSSRVAVSYTPSF
jgi:hypothetical protein